ncbi:hypothetical protein NPIL_285951 [Nephila pilipes]|uniref:Uncharacterized protein n=1 Tax=Nephila pilipes TaxID=299642 RepID=A0A8X6N9Q9_NEPPI|nr:hypothetical protein NPIL_285951 [Nephila pilipes]
MCAPPQHNTADGTSRRCDVSHETRWWIRTPFIFVLPLGIIETHILAHMIESLDRVSRRIRWRTYLLAAHPSTPARGYLRTTSPGTNPNKRRRSPRKHRRHGKS